MTVRRYIAYCLIAALALVTLLLPNRSVPDADAPSELAYAIAAASKRFHLHSELLRREHSRVLAQEAVRSLSRDTTRLVVVASREQTVLAQPIRRLFGDAAALAPRTPFASRVVFVVASDGDSVIAGVPVVEPRYWGNTDAFPPGSIVDDACVLVIRVSARSMMRYLDHWPPRLGGDLMTACRWYAAYGAPGAGIARWLDSTQYAAFKALPIPLRSFDEPDERLRQANYYYVGDQTAPTLAKCSAGARGACAALILRPPGTFGGGGGADYVNTPGWFGTRAWSTTANRLATTMLFELEREIGPHGFAEFWRSDEDLPAAFARARGESLERWTRSLINGARPAYRAGPAPSPIVTMGLLALLPGLLALGIRGVMHRGRFS